MGVGRGGGRKNLGVLGPTPLCYGAQLATYKHAPSSWVTFVNLVTLGQTVMA